MTGLNILNSRLEELKGILSVRCDWMLVPEKRLRRDQASSEDLGCIGCHFGYFASGYSVARQLSCDSIACGFVAYQNSWVEQTPYAVERLRALMSEYGSTLLLPVAELRSKAEVQAELATYGVTKDSLELKCSKQEIDPGLVAGSLKATVDQGIEALRMAMGKVQRPERPLQEIAVSGKNA